MNDEILIEIHNAKDLIVSLNEIEGIVNILAISDTIKENMKERITGIRNILKEAKLRNEVKND